MKKYDGDAAAQKPCYYFLKLFNPPRCPPDQVNVSIFDGIVFHSIFHAFWMVFHWYLNGAVLNTIDTMFNTCDWLFSTLLQVAKWDEQREKGIFPGHIWALFSVLGVRTLARVRRVSSMPLAHLLHSANGHRHLTCYFVSVSMIISCAAHATLS